MLLVRSLFSVLLACAAWGAWAADTDGDGIPDDVEQALQLEPTARDNDLLAPTAFGARLFAMQQYRDFLGREGDAQGVEFWTSQLSSGARTRALMVEAYFDSPEFQGRGAPIVRMYFTYFLRIPDAGGLEYWMGRFRSGMSLEAISDLFAGSPEFAQRYGALSNAQFVTLVYRNVLGRDPDSGGLAYWTAQLATISRGQMMVAFSESPEYRSLSAHEVYVTMMYVGLLRRAPEPSGFAFWVGYRDAGNSGLALIEAFLASPEFRARFGPGPALDGIRDDIAAYIEQVHGADPGRRRIVREYARALEAIATGLSTPSLVDSLGPLRNCASYLQVLGAWPGSGADLVELLARTGLSKRRTLELIAAFDATPAPRAPLEVAPSSCPFDPVTGQAFPPGAPGKETQPQCRPDTHIYFANGVWNDAEAAVDGLHELMTLGLLPTPRSKLKYLNMFNRMRGPLMDVVEVFEQKRSESPGLPWTQFWRWTRGIASSPVTDVFLAFQSAQARILAESLRALRTAPSQYLAEIDSVVELYAGNIRSALEAGNNVLIVAHSQGNLFANEVYNRVKVRGFSRRDSLKIVAVATPADVQPNRIDRYTTLGANLDAVGPLNGADRIIQLLSAVVPVLEPTTTLTTSEILFGANEPTFHYFGKTYLRHDTPRMRIKSHVLAALDELQVEGGCTKTLLLEPPAQVPVNTQVVFTVEVQPNTTGDTAGQAPRGEFEVRDGPNRLCGGILDGGRGSCAHIFTSGGVRELRAHYLGGGSLAPAWQPSVSDPRTTAVGSGVASANALAYASANTGSCDFNGGAVDNPTCLGVEKAESAASFSITASRGTGSGTAGFSGGVVNASASTSPGGAQAAPRGDGVVRLSNRFSIASATLPAGSPVRLTFRLPVSGSVSAAVQDNQQCTSASTAQALFSIALNYSSLPAGRSAAIPMEVGSRVQRFACNQVRQTVRYQSNIAFGYANGSPTVAGAPQLQEIDGPGVAASQTLGPVTVTVDTAVGEEFQFFVQLHVNASMRGGQASSSGNVSLGPVEATGVPAGVVVQRVP